MHAPPRIGTANFPDVQDFLRFPYPAQALRVLTNPQGGMPSMRLNDQENSTGSPPGSLQSVVVRD